MWGIWSPLSACVWTDNRKRRDSYRRLCFWHWRRFPSDVSFTDDLQIAVSGRERRTTLHSWQMEWMSDGKMTQHHGKPSCRCIRSKVTVMDLWKLKTIHRRLDGLFCQGRVVSGLSIDRATVIGSGFLWGQTSRKMTKWSVTSVPGAVTQSMGLSSILLPLRITWVPAGTADWVSLPSAKSNLSES